MSEHCSTSMVLGFSGKSSHKIYLAALAFLALLGFRVAPSGTVESAAGESSSFGDAALLPLAEALDLAVGFAAAGLHGSSDC